MKKVLILSIPLILAILFFSLNNNSKTNTSITGKWQLCGKDSLISTNVNGKIGMSRYKIISDKTFIVTEIKNVNKTFFTDFIGSYTINNNVYTEKIEYTHPNLREYFGRTFTYEFKVEGDLMFNKGQDNIYDEIWKKIE